MRNNYLFTSESVTEGHPDKIADQISDGILDAIIAQDKHSRVACETILTTGIAFVAGQDDHGSARNQRVEPQQRAHADVEAQSDRNRIP